jgi:Tol biopolymer transport system component
MQRTGLFRLSAWGWCAILQTAALLLIAACSSDDGPTAAPAPIPTVLGKVLSVRTGEPVAGAEVSIGTATATTGLDGSFRLTDLVAGAAILRCKAEGFQNLETDIVVADGLTTQQTLRLAPVVKSMSFDPGVLTITVGYTNQLSLADQDGGSLLTPNVMTLTSDHEKVASVQRGYDEEQGFYAVVVGITPGEATITAESGGVTATATISVVAATPSSNKLAFLRGDAIFVSDFAGAEPVLLVRLADLGEGAHDFALSRDGSMIAFVSASGREICIARSNGSDRRCTTSEVFDSYGNFSALAWSPDGRDLVYSGEPSHWMGDRLGFAYDPQMSLFSLAADKMTTKKLVATPEGSHATGATWATDGTKIAFAMDGAIWTVNRDGSDLRMSARVSDNISGVEWSRNGRLAFAIWGWRGVCPWFCDTAIAIADADGTGFKVLATARAADDAYVGGPAWSSDATLVAYDYQDCSAGWDPCHSDIFVARTDNGGKALLIRDAELIRWRP